MSKSNKDQIKYNSKQGIIVNHKPKRSDRQFENNSLKDFETERQLRLAKRLC